MSNMNGNKKLTQKNYYRILGINTVRELPQIEVTDELIQKKYEQLKQVLVNQLEKIKNDSGNESSIKNIELSLQLVEEAYKMLNTEDKRKKYEEPYIKLYGDIMKLAKIIEDEGGNPNKKLETRTKNLSNRAAEVRKNSQYLEYTTEFEDDRIRIAGIEEINFWNGNLYKDSINSYTIFFKEGEEEKPSGYDFYSKIKKIKMEDKEYKIAVLQAIKEGMKSKEKYIGIIESDKDGTYHIESDDGQKYAVIEREKQKENERREKSQRCER